MKLLIVDDNPLNLKLLRAQLEAVGHAVVSAENGVEALEALEHESFDAVVSDILMPDMDGFRLCFEIRRSSRLHALPLVLYTATYTSPSDRDLAKDVGADAYIAKPAPVGEILATVDAAVRGLRPRRGPRALPSDAEVLQRYSVALVRKLEQKNIELGDANERLNDLFENSHDLIQVIAADGRFLYVNRAWRELLGYDDSDLPALRIFDLVAPEAHASCELMFDRMRRGESALNFELQMRSKDGRYVPFEGGATPRIVDGELVAIRCIWRNVTDRKLAEAAQQRLAAIVDYSTDAIVGKDLGGVVTSWNASAERLFGYTADEMIGTPIDRLIPDDRKHEEKEILGRLSRGEPVDHFESVRMRKDGRAISVSLTISPILDAAGKLVGASKIARDVTLHKAAEAARRASDERLNGLINSSMDAIVTIDDAQNITQFNPAAERMFGLPQEDAIGTPLMSLLPARYHAKHQQYVAEFGRTGSTTRRIGSPAELVGVRRDGSEFPVEVTISHTEMISGHYYMAILRDITERKMHTNKIARLARIQTAMSRINAAILHVTDRQQMFDDACRIVHEDGGFAIVWIGRYDKEADDVNAAAWRGLEGETATAKASARTDLEEGRGLAGRAIRSRALQFTNDLSADSMAEGARGAEAAARGLHSGIALPLIVENEVEGVMVLYAAGKDFFTDAEIPLLVEIASNISFALLYIAREKRAHLLAYYDTLTGLANRTLFVDRLAQALRIAARNGSRVAVIVGDIDRFRQVNEAFGRNGGDALLRQIAARTSELSPEPDNSARIAADEFAALIVDVQSPESVAQRVAAALRSVSEAVFDVGGEAVTVTMTGGVAIAPDDGEDAEQLLANAQLALARAKQAGETFVFFQPDMAGIMTAALVLENKLRRAIEKRQFELCYQPEFDARTGKIVCLEALLRWNDPDAGLVAPASFIGVLETTGMIIEVGEWVLRHALMQARQWRDEGLEPPRIAVNVSPRQLQDRNFVETVSRVLSEHRDVSVCLDLEITESMVMSDAKGAIAKLSAIRDMGVGIAIDDFGTGYSSLAYLTLLPVNALKIDRAFVSAMTIGTEGLAIVTTIISLAHSLNLKVIAEGVETDEQAKYLRLLKCDDLQGYLFSKPLTPDQIRDFMRANAAEH